MIAIQQEPTPDMSPETLGALSALMLAQSQEIFVHKAIHDTMKDGIIARLAAQAEELYAEALKLFQKEIFRSFWDKEWVPLVSCLKLIITLYVGFNSWNEINVNTNFVFFIDSR